MTVTYQTCEQKRRQIINCFSEGRRVEVVPLQVSVKILGTIANVREGDVDLLSLQAGVT